MEWLIAIFLMAAGTHFFLLSKIARAVGYQRLDHKAIEPLTVIVAARNEAQNIEVCLNALLANDYSEDWYILVVNDRSEDDTGAILEALSARHPRLSILHISHCPEGMPPKKHALTQAIQNAQTDLLLFIDADCIAPPNWVQSMAEGFRGSTELVLGTSPYLRRPGFLNALIQYETLQTAFLYLGMAGLELPYMGVGRSLAYRKSFFENIGGFQSGIQSLSGDDDLLVNHHGRGRHTSTVRSSPVLSIPPDSWHTWWRQKLRHLSAGKWYRPERMIYPGLFQSSWLLALITGLIISIYKPFPLLIILYVFSLFRFFLWVRTVKFQGNYAREFVLLPLLECFFVLYQVGMIPLGMILKPKWTSSHPHPPEQKKTEF